MYVPLGRDRTYISNSQPISLQGTSDLYDYVCGCYTDITGRLLDDDARRLVADGRNLGISPPLTIKNEEIGYTTLMEWIELKGWYLMSTSNCVQYGNSVMAFTFRQDETHNQQSNMCQYYNNEVSEGNSDSFQDNLENWVYQWMKKSNENTTRPSAHSNDRDEKRAGHWMMRSFNDNTLSKERQLVIEGCLSISE